MNNSKKVWNVIAIIAIVIAVILGINLYNKNTSYANVVQNDNNKAFYEVVDRIQNSKIYLAKSMISKEARHGAKTLMEVWRETDLATCYLSMVPIESQEIENTEKFLNQVSEYSYTMANKCIDGQDLSDEEMDKIQELYNYANDLSNTLNEMITELNNGIIKWEDLKKNSEGSDISEVSNFNMVEQNFHEYSGLIYDGAFSEHITSEEKKGLIGNDISEDEAKIIAEEFIGKDKIKETKNNGYVENGNIPVYRFEVTTNENKKIGISISKKGGHLVYMNYDRETNGENITEQDEVDAMAKAINDAIDALVFQLKIKYNSNGGTGTMTNPAIELDKEFTFPKCEYVAPNGKHFKGWQVDSTIYKVGDPRVFTKDDQNKEIKAVWEEHTFDQKLKEVNGVSTLKDKATCTTNAIYYKSCTCGQVSTTETFEDKDTKLGHEYTKQIKDEKYLKSQGSNCQEHDAYWYVCSRCDASAKDDENAQDKYYESAEVGNHVYDQEVESSEYLATPATCMTPARYYKSCICGAKGTEAFAATGTHLGHAYIEVKNPQFLREKATNCKEHDTYWYVCSRCGKTSKTINKYYEDKDSKGEHISSDWIIDQQPTVAKEGSKHKECTVCKEVLETEKIAKLENVKTETKKEETASKKETKVESKKAVTTEDNTNSIVPMALLGISLLGIYIIVMKKYVR